MESFLSKYSKNNKTKIILEPFKLKQLSSKKIFAL